MRPPASLISRRCTRRPRVRPKSKSKKEHADPTFWAQMGSAQAMRGGGLVDEDEPSVGVWPSPMCGHSATALRPVEDGTGSEA